MIRKLLKLINIINIGLKNKSKVMKINKNHNLKIIQIFIKINIIKFIKISNNGFVLFVNNSFKNKNYHIKTIYKKSKKLILNSKNLKTKKGVYILSTNKGFLNNFESSKRKIGGFLLFELIVKK